IGAERETPFLIGKAGGDFIAFPAVQGPSSGQVPDGDLTVGIAGGQSLPVRAEEHRGDKVAVPRKRLKGLVGAGIPDGDVAGPGMARVAERGIATGGGEAESVGTEGDTVD